MTDPLSLQGRGGVALLIDADNLSSPDAVEEALRKLTELCGPVAIRRAYGSADNLKGLAGVMRDLAIRPIINDPLSKNTTDILLAVDALDLWYQCAPSVIAIGTGDADFAPLVLRLRERGVRLICFSQRTKLSPDIRSYYEQVLIVRSKSAAAADDAVVRLPSPGRSAGTSPRPTRREAEPRPSRSSRSARSGRASGNHDRGEPRVGSEVAWTSEAVEVIETARAPDTAELAEASGTADAAGAVAIASAASAPARKTPARSRSRAAPKAVPVVDANESVRAPSRGGYDTDADGGPAGAAQASLPPAAVDAPPPSRMFPVREPAPAAPVAAIAPAPAAATLDEALQAILQAVPGLQDGQSVALNEAVRLLHDAKLLGKNASSLKFFKKHGARFELTPDVQPTRLRFMA